MLSVPLRLVVHHVGHFLGALGGLKLCNADGHLLRLPGR